MSVVKRYFTLNVQIFKPCMLRKNKDAASKQHGVVLIALNYNVMLIKLYDQGALRKVLLHSLRSLQSTFNQEHSYVIFPLHGTDSSCSQSTDLCCTSK